MSPEELDVVLRVLREVADDRGVLASTSREHREELQKLAGEVARPDLKQRKKLQKALARAEKLAKKKSDDDARERTGIRELRRLPVFMAPLLPPPAPDTSGPSELHEERKCYVCKAPYTTLHHFYDQLCPACGDVNFAKRTARVDLAGKVALVTGARVKIGYQAALLLLRAGCRVIALTRFPRDAARRYEREPDFASWRERLEVRGIDLRHTPSVELLCQQLSSSLERLDFQLHNACQTVRRPPGFYGHLLEGEQAALAPAAAALTAAHERAPRLRDSALLTQAASPEDRALATSSAEIFPRGVLDADLQQVDLRTHNSWRLTLGEVPTLELLEVLLVNATAPFVMAAKLKPLMTRAPGAKHIVMVSAMEGQFYREHKTDKHPHTNMAKAALNMIVRTSAPDYAKDEIYLNAVDTGWVTDEDPAHLAARKVEEHRFSPPLDIVDGAARIVDPIFEGYRTGQHACGFFFKDYQPTPW